MLVLSRKLGESVQIGDRGVLVRVLSIKRAKVQLGIDAPPDIAVHRSEKAEQYIDDGLVSSKDANSSGSQRAIDPSASPQARAEGRRRPKSRPSVAESVIDDIRRTQAEVRALAEMATVGERQVAREMADGVVARLNAIERSVELSSDHASEHPIAEFMATRRGALGRLDSSEKATETSNSEHWRESHGDSTTVARETSAAYFMSDSSCPTS